VNNLVIACLGAAAFFMIIERVFPARELPKVKGWWLRVTIINAFYASLVILGGYTWDPLFQKIKLGSFFDNTHPIFAAAVCYVLITFVYYWWHRARHRSTFLWRIFHQLHHSPARIETITSLYKHPAEILINTFITSTCAYIILGLNLVQVQWTLFFMAVAEYIYHVNIRTPHWLGYFFQRPEMHRVHHQRGLHRYNYSDLPIFDMMFGTFKNPIDQELECGLGIHNEESIGKLIAGKLCEDKIM
jgi:sterol desaturase/sphingolipid hydroxylase (fatty acid hydroxylase superfamily)